MKVVSADRSLELRHRQRLLLCASLAALTAVSSARAQNTGPVGNDTKRTQLETIVVTSQKRAQRVVDVPIAVTALTAATLRANRVQTVADLSGLAPNVTVRPAAGGVGIPAFSIRGITSYGIVPGSDKETSIYLDGVYLGSPAGSTFELPDISRIEVLRGPQGTLFGRNATAGAVSIVTRDPTGELAGHQEFTFGNYNQFRTRTTVDFPSYGPFSLYASYVHDERQGDIKNLGAGTIWNYSGAGSDQGTATSPRYLGDKDVNSYFVALKFKPTEYFSTIYKFDLENNHYTPDGQAAIGFNPGAPLIGPLISSLVESQPTPVSFDTSGKRPNAVNNSFALPGFQHNEGHSLTSNLTLTDDLSLKNILAYRESSIYTPSQIDGLGGLVLTPQAVVPYATLSAFSLYPTNPALAESLIPVFAKGLAPRVGQRFVVITDTTEDISRQYSEEMQANYHSKFLTLTAGGIWFHQDDRAGAVPDLPNEFEFTSFPNNGQITPGGTGTSYNQATSYAGYGQAEIHILPTLDLVGGVRLTHDDKSGDYVHGGTFIPGPGGSFANGVVVGKLNDPFTYSGTKPTYSIGANYKPIKNSLVYVKYSTGFVSGGSVGGIAFKPETVASEEIGAKADFLDHRAFLSVALFNADYQNVQASANGLNVGRPDLGTVIITQGNSNARGFELEGSVRPVEGVTLGGSIGYTYTSLGPVNPILRATEGGVYDPTLIPRWTTDIYAEYDTAPVYKNAYMVFRTDTTWRTKEPTLQNPAYEFLPGFGPITQTDPAAIVNATVSLRDIPLWKTKASISLWVRNLTNDKDEQFPLAFTNFLASSDFQAARTYGVDLFVDF